VAAPAALLRSTVTGTLPPPLTVMVKDPPLDEAV
jgi:hypothetical protein